MGRKYLSLTELDAFKASATFGFQRRCSLIGRQGGLQAHIVPLPKSREQANDDTENKQSHHQCNGQSSTAGLESNTLPGNWRWFRFLFNSFGLIALGDVTTNVTQPYRGHCFAQVENGSLGFQH